MTFHDTLPRRGPTQPTIGLTVISGYGASLASLRLPTTVPSLIISRTFPPGGLWWRLMPPFGHWSADPSAERAFDRLRHPLRGRYVALSSAASSVENENDIRGEIFGYRSALIKLMYRRTGLSCGYRRRLYPAACPILRTPTERGRKSWCDLAGRRRQLTSVYFEDCRHIFFGMASNSIG